MPSVRPRVLRSVCTLFLGFMVSCSTPGDSSPESRFTMGLLGWMNFKASSLERVNAGLSLVDTSGLKPRPEEPFTRKFLVTREDIQGHGVYTVSPRDKAPTVTVFYLHGGGYSVTFADSHWKFFEELILSTGCTIVAPDYPLPPQADWKASWDMVRQAYLRLPEKESPILMGDSAGGGFALALAQELAAEGHRNPRLVILLSPWLDLSMSNPDIPRMEASDPLLSREALVVCARRWARGTPLVDRRLSPLYGPLEGLPPVVLFTGTADILNPDARKLRDLSSPGNPDFAYREYQGMMHVWMLFDFPESRKAKEEIFRWVN